MDPKILQIGQLTNIYNYAMLRLKNKGKITNTEYISPQRTISSNQNPLKKIRL